ncbi:hypothetical protein SAMN02910264_00330 [Ruminococcaceae bacterium YAD3003]|nr:hypothetical protein SAMN02910264_00330 [Ruminococcaceae bacterium YAD3003]
MGKVNPQSWTKTLGVFYETTAQSQTIREFYKYMTGKYPTESQIVQYIDVRMRFEENHFKNYLLSFFDCKIHVFA